MMQNTQNSTVKWSRYFLLKPLSKRFEPKIEKFNDQYFCEIYDVFNVQ